MILDRIVKYKKRFVLALKKKTPFRLLKKQVRALPRKKTMFLKALSQTSPVAVIAEIKRRSPSKGILKKGFDPVRLARALDRGGAPALSVLTDEKFFGGSTGVLRKIRAVTRLPILRKDFIVDEYQVWESRLIGADAVLLIAAVLSAGEIKKFSAVARRLGHDVLLEVNTEADAQKALKIRARLVGINNRDLGTFRVGLSATRRLARRFPESVYLVSESGIQNHDDLIYLKACGVRAVLVGESLMKHRDPGAALKELTRQHRG